MRYLAIAQRTRQECNGAGTGPSAVTNQTGEPKRFVDWCADAYTQIQNKRTDWLWMRKGFTFNSTIGLSEYAYTAITDVDTAVAITRLAYWYRDSMKAYLQTDGVGTEYPLVFLEWETFRRIYRYGTQNNQQPIHVSIDPQLRLCLGPKPDAVYVVSGDYQRSPQILAADDDTPEFPSQFHMLVVYEAMKKYAGYESAPEVLVSSNVEAIKMWRDLERQQLPPITWGDALA
jgi:hypothetical protein